MATVRTPGRSMEERRNTIKSSSSVACFQGVRSLSFHPMPTKVQKVQSQLMPAEAMRRSMPEPTSNYRYVTIFVIPATRTNSLKPRAMN
jgi:hypothetical protein